MLGIINFDRSKSTHTHQLIDDQSRIKKIPFSFSVSLVFYPQDQYWSVSEPCVHITHGFGKFKIKNFPQINNQSEVLRTQSGMCHWEIRSHFTYPTVSCLWTTSSCRLARTAFASTSRSHPQTAVVSLYLSKNVRLQSTTGKRSRPYLPLSHTSRTSSFDVQNTHDLTLKNSHTIG